MRKIIFATGNPDKVKEVKGIMAELPVEVFSMKEIGISSSPEENGTTFEENAVIKASAVAQVLPEEYRDAIVMADDSGLEIDALYGAPGIRSARYMGEDTSYHIKNKNLISRISGVPEQFRTARFVCAIAAVLPGDIRGKAEGEAVPGEAGASSDAQQREVLTVRGTIEGKIGYEERGENGFGYDPIFYLPDLSRSTAELSFEEKNAISHRGNALRAMAARLKDIL